MRLHLLCILCILTLVSPCMGVEPQEYYLNEKAMFSSNYGSGTISVTKYYQDPIKSQFVVNYSADYQAKISQDLKAIGIYPPINTIDFTFILKDTQTNAHNPINVVTFRNFEDSYASNIHVSEQGSIYYNVPKGSVADSIEIQYDKIKPIKEKKLVFKLKEPYRFYWNHAVELINQSKYSEAIDEINKSIEIEPTNGQLYFVRGFGYYKNNQLPEAISDFETSIKLNPQLPDSYLYLGEIYQKEMKNKEAIEAYTGFLNHLPPNTTNQFYIDNRIYANQEIKKMSKNQIPGFSLVLSGFSLCIAGYFIVRPKYRNSR